MASTNEQIPVVIEGSGEVEYLPPGTLVVWPPGHRSQSQHRLESFGERPRETSGDHFKLPDGRLARFEGWKDEALRLRGERDEARNWVRRMTHETRVLTCAFCGEAYPPGTPESNHESLLAHVKVCAKHPMREVERQRDEHAEARAVWNRRFSAVLAEIPRNAGDPFDDAPAQVREMRTKVLAMGHLRAELAKARKLLNHAANTFDDAAALLDGEDIDPGGDRANSFRAFAAELREAAKEPS